MSAYLIEVKNLKILVDTGWHREISPKGIRETSLNENCVESLANHDAEVVPHEIIL